MNVSHFTVALRLSWFIILSAILSIPDNISMLVRYDACIVIWDKVAVTPARIEAFHHERRGRPDSEPAELTGKNTIDGIFREQTSAIPAVLGAVCTKTRPDVR